MNPVVLTLFGEMYEPQPAKKKKQTKPKKDSLEQEKPENIAEKLHLPIDWKAEKLYYSIGEVAALFEVNVSKIRYWTIEFGLKVRTTQKGDRLFNEENIKELSNIYSLVTQRGYTLSGAKAALKAPKQKAKQNQQLLKKLSQLKEQLIQLRDSLPTS